MTSSWKFCRKYVDFAFFHPSNYCFHGQKETFMLACLLCSSLDSEMLSKSKKEKGGENSTQRPHHLHTVTQTSFSRACHMTSLLNRPCNLQHNLVRTIFLSEVSQSLTPATGKWWNMTCMKQLNPHKHIWNIPYHTAKTTFIIIKKSYQHYI